MPPSNSFGLSVLRSRSSFDERVSLRRYCHRSRCSVPGVLRLGCPRNLRVTVRLTRDNVFSIPYPSPHDVMIDDHGMISICYIEARAKTSEAGLEVRKTRLSSTLLKRHNIARWRLPLTAAASRLNPFHRESPPAMRAAARVPACNLGNLQEIRVWKGETLRASHIPHP
jgi:hypothetical protein